MMRFIALSLCLFATHVCSKPKQTVFWLYSEMPPAHIVQGKHKDAGYADLTIKLISQALPQYNHIKVQANYKRSVKELGKHDNYCHAALLKSKERQDYVAYSEPVYVLGANELYVLKDNARAIERFLTADRRLDLNALLTEENFQLGISSGAYYGEGIERILNMPNSADNLVIRTAIDHYSGLSDMLHAGKRLDGFLALSIENKFFYQLYGDSNEKMVSYPVAGAEDFLIGYVGCSNSSFGQQLIEEINQVLIQERHKKIKSYYQDWLLPDEKEVHQSLIDRLF